jgi:hypothetical protein
VSAMGEQGSTVRTFLLSSWSNRNRASSRYRLRASYFINNGRKIAQQLRDEVRGRSLVLRFVSL